jgi:nicotinate-nucleotide adenylyltransferase
MVRLAIAGQPGAEVSTIETERDGPSYTVETLAAFAERHSGSALYFIVGEDALADLPNWVEPERIIELATLAVAHRAGREPADAGWRNVPGIERRVTWLEMEPLPISACDIRRRIGAGESVEGLLLPAVEAYIREHGLYGCAAAPGSV